MAHGHRTLSADIAATLAWWREAGVDCAFTDEAHGWLAATPEEEQAHAQAALLASLPQPKPAAGAEPARAMIGGDRAGWPADLAGFRAWWLAEPSLDAGLTAGRVPPRGPAGAELMVLVPHPEEEDAAAGEGGTLLSGPQGRLLAAILAAAGIAADAAYVASALPRHTPHADWAGLAAAGLGDVLAHHLALAAPRRLLVFGTGIPPLLGHDPAQRTALLPIVNQEAATVPLLVAPELGHLARRPGAKAAFWRLWLQSTGSGQPA